MSKYYELSIDPQPHSMRIAMNFIDDDGTWRI